MKRNSFVFARLDLLVLKYCSIAPHAVSGNAGSRVCDLLQH